MRLSVFPTAAFLSLFALLLAACSGVEVDSAPVEKFAATGYRYYQWRSEPLPPNPRSGDPIYLLDSLVRKEVDANLRNKGYVMDPQRAQFTVDWRFGRDLRDGEVSEHATNISPIPRVIPNRRVDQASVDNAIALGGVKETSNIVLRFDEAKTNRPLWGVALTKIVEDANRVDAAKVGKLLHKQLDRALDDLPAATHVK